MLQATMEYTSLRGMGYTVTHSCRASVRPYLGLFHEHRVAY
jgi:hypothetical protein